MSKVNFDFREIAKILGKPVYEGDFEDDRNIWIGLVKSEKIDEMLVYDERLRNRLITLTKNLERNVRRHRQLVKQLREKDFTLASESQIHEQILELQMKIGECNMQVINFFAEYGTKQMDLYLYDMMLCKEYERLAKENPAEIARIEKEAKKVLDNLIVFAEDSDPCTREHYIDGKYKCFQYFTIGQEKRHLKGADKNKEALRNLIVNITGGEELTEEEMKETLGDFFSILRISELKQFFSNSMYATTQLSCGFKNYLLENGYTYEEIESMSTTEITDTVLNKWDLDEEDKIIRQIMIQTISEGLDQLDLEKLLLVTVSNQIERLKRNSKDENLITSEYIEQSRQTELIIKKILEMDLISSKARGTIKVEDSEKVVSLRTIKKSMENFCDGIYLTDDFKETLIYDAYIFPELLESFSDELLCRMEYTEEKKFMLSLVNFENLKRLYTLGKLSKQDIKSILELVSSGEIERAVEEWDSDFENIGKLLNRNSKNFLKNLFDAELINEEEVKTYFEEGIISKEMLDTLEDNRTAEEKQSVHEKLKRVFDEETMLRKYKKYVEKYVEFMNLQKNSPSETERIEALREEVNKLRIEKDLYKELFTRYNPERSESEKDKLLEQYYFNLEVEDEAVLQESIKFMYEDGIIDLENIIHFDKDYVIPMLDSLSLDDASKVRNSMSFKELQNMLDTIFEDKKITDERKFIIVMNLLGEDTEEDKEAREFYLSLLEFDDLEKRPKPKRKKDKDEDEETTIGGGKESKKYVYPDIVKWKFYKALDKDVRVTRYLNGYVEFASSKLGVRIIEKYYDENKPAYGTATYILPEEEYKRNQGELITEGAKGKTLESTVLRKITPKKDRIVHRTQGFEKTWMDQIVKYFGVDYEKENDSRYTQEELSRLQNTVNNLKNQYIVMEK